MVLHLAFQGLRVSELRGIKHGDIDLNDEIPNLHVTGKGNKHRYIPLNPELVNHISSSHGIRSPLVYLQNHTLSLYSLLDFLISHIALGLWNKCF